MSLLIILHLFALFVAVTSYSSPNFAAPVLAVRAADLFQPYLQSTFLNNAYRFFAPNPGIPTVLWFRIQYEDKSVRWFEVPGKSEGLTRANYQRRLNLAIQIAQQVLPDPARDGKPTLTPAGQAGLASFVRHVTSLELGDRAAHVRNVGVYFVQHAGLTPDQVRTGWGQLDLRTYRPLFVGAFTPAGERVDEFRPDLVEQSIFFVAAGIVQIDVLPRVRSGQDTSLILKDLALPEPIHRLLVKHSALTDSIPGTEDLRTQIERAVEAGSR